MNEELQVGLGLKIDKFQEGLKSATRNVDSFANKLKSPLKALEGFRSAIAGGIGLATIQQLSDYAEQLRNMSEALGVTTGDLQRFYNSVSFSGISVETANKSLTKFIQHINSAAGGSIESGDAFAKIGVSLKDSNGEMRNTMDILMDVADAFQRTENKANNGRLAVELFGKQGLKLVGFLNQGRKAIEELGQTGPILSEEAIDALDRMGDDIKQIFDSLKANSGEWVSYLAPLVENTKNQFFGLRDVINSVTEALLVMYNTKPGADWMKEGENVGKQFLRASLLTTPVKIAFSLAPSRMQKDFLMAIGKRKPEDGPTPDETKARELALAQVAKAQEDYQRKLAQFNLENANGDKKRLILGEEINKVLGLRVEAEKNFQKTNEPKYQREALEHAAKELDLRKQIAQVEDQNLQRRFRMADLANQQVALDKSVELLGLGMRQAVLQDRINKMSKLGPEFITAENELRKNAIEIAKREVATEREKVALIEKRGEELQSALRAAQSDPNGGARAAKIEEEIQQNIVKLQQQKIELAKRAGEEQVKLANLQATLQQKVNQLKESKEDASKYTIEEFAKVGGWGNAANRKAWDKVMEFRRGQERIDWLRGHGANPEEIQKAIEAREAIRKQLDPRFIKSTDLRSPFQDLEDAIRKLTAEIKAQQDVAKAWADPLKNQGNIKELIDALPMIQIGNEAQLHSSKTLEEIKKLLSEPLKVKPVNGP